MELIPGEFEKFGEQIDIFEKYKEVNIEPITTKKVEKMTLSYKQLVVILEALHNYKIDIEKLEGENEVALRHKYKVNEINEIFKYIEQGIKYNFDNAINKCKDKHLKQLNQFGKNDDEGMETFSWLGGSQ